MPTNTLDPQTATPTSLMAGGWTPFRALTPADLAVFNEAQKPLGVDYTPKQVATQVVAGINYCFRCEAKAVVLHPEPYPALVYIYKPLKGAPIVTEIKRINA